MHSDNPTVDDSSNSVPVTAATGDEGAANPAAGADGSHHHGHHQHSHAHHHHQHHESKGEAGERRGRVMDLRSAKRGHLSKEAAAELVAAHLADEAVAADITHAHLSTWALDEESATVLAEALKKLPALEGVDFSDIVAGRPEAQGLAVYRILSEALVGRHFTEINVSDNALGPKGLEAFRLLLENQPRLRHAYFCRNGLSAEAMRTLAGWLSAHGATALRTLHLFNNMAGDGGAIAMADVAAKSPHLQDFRFSSSRASAEGGAALAEALLNHSSLVRLELNDNCFDAEVGKTLAKVIRKNTNLTHLDLGDLGLEEGMKAVSKAIGECKGITWLNLASNDINEESVGALAKAIAQLPHLKVLNLEGNIDICSDGAKKLAKSLASCVELESLNVGGCGIGSEGAAALVKAIATHPNLQSVDFTENNVSRSTARELRRSLGDRATILQHLSDNEAEDDEEDDDGADDDEDADEEAEEAAGGHVEASDAAVDDLARDLAAADLE